MLPLSPLELLILALVVVGVGVVSNIAGFGGAIFVIPLLLLVFDVPPKIAIGSSLAAIAFPALVGFLSAWRRHEVDFTAGIVIELPTMVGAVVGASFVSVVDNHIIHAIFGMVALTLAVVMGWRSWKTRGNIDLGHHFPLLKRLTKIRPWYRINKEDYSYRLSLPFMTGVGFLIGVLSGLLGVGGGWIKTPFLIFVVGLPPVVASGTALFMLVFTSVSGGLVHFLSGHWDLELFLTLAVSLSVGALGGDKLKHRIGSYQISLVVAGSLFIVALVMLAESVM